MVKKLTKQITKEAKKPEPVATKEKEPDSLERDLTPEVLGPTE